MAAIIGRKLGMTQIFDEEDGTSTPVTVIEAQPCVVTAIRNAERDGYDAILLDAPCSGLGTIGRHPEVRWRRTPEDLTATSTLQRRLLETSAPHLAVGGRLVYAVCSWAPEEGREVIRDFLARHPEFAEEPLPGESAQELPGRLLFPDTDDTDGFFVARLRRLC